MNPSSLYVRGDDGWDDFPNPVIIGTCVVSNPSICAVTCTNKTNSLANH